MEQLPTSTFVLLRVEGLKAFYSRQPVRTVEVHWMDTEEPVCLCFLSLFSFFHRSFQIVMDPRVVKWKFSEYSAPYISLIKNIYKILILLIFCNVKEEKKS